MEALRSDPALHYTDAAEIVADAERAMAKSEAAMRDWFGRLPKAGCTVKGVPTGAKAYYFPPAEDGSRGGTYFINVGEPASWGRFELENVSYHEAIPGHHLQLAIAMELEGLPSVRRKTFISAYDEGWGLYTERLADEMGLYGSALDRMGMLSADSMRACRLVVDTGMHHLGWTRQQAVDFMWESSALTMANIVNEVDRYIAWPGQACAYMIGRLEILDLRARAREQLGPRFDIRAFHDAVLLNGSVPLDVLRDEVTGSLLTYRAGSGSGPSPDSPLAASRP
jgi:uncharacterized protein (DUF885 family)